MSARESVGDGRIDRLATIIESHAKDDKKMFKRLGKAIDRVNDKTDARHSSNQKWLISILICTVGALLLKVLDAVQVVAAHAPH